MIPHQVSLTVTSDYMRMAPSYMYKTINSGNNAMDPQRALDSLVEWSEENGLF